MSTRNFYHSFSRPRSSETTEEATQKGLDILAGITSLGLVLAPEVVEWVIPQVDGTTKVLRYRQARICFTELSEEELSEHGKTFGPFSLEFPTEILRQFGLLPVIYVPQMIEGRKNLSALGPVLVWMFENARSTLDQLDQLLKIVSVADPNCTINLQNKKGDQIAQMFEVKSGVLRDVLSYLSFETAPFEMMRGAVYAAQMLFYPTDNLITDEHLSYYRQREWRLIPGLTMDGKLNARHATNSEKQFLLGVDQRFWSREISDDRGTFKRIDEVQIVGEFQGKPIAEAVKRLFVPAAGYDRARKLFGGEIVAV